jgi:ADP-ribose pyrophosphatase
VTIELELLDEEFHGATRGFFSIRRLRLCNHNGDGSRSQPYTCEFVERPKGVDAVVVVLWRRNAETIEVLLRDGLRPALWFGRHGVQLPVADDVRRMWMTEVVAGILELEDMGEAGIRKRAAIEAWEEAGLQVDPTAVAFLGAGTFPTPGSMPEKYWLVCAEVALDAPVHPPEGDGSPMEHGATTRWCELDRAIAACVAGEIVDAKTELALRRLRDAVRRVG